MADYPVGGALSYVVYGEEETAYGTASAAIAGNTGIAFGHGLTIEVDRKNNFRRTFGIGARSAQKLTVLQYEGTITLNFLLGTGHWFGAVLGGASSAAAGAAYDHTYVEADTLDSITIENGIDLGTTDHVARLLGCKIDECTLSLAVGEPVRVKLVCPYKTETEGTALDATPAVDPEEIMTFAQGSVDLPSGSTLVNIQTLDLTIKNGLDRTLGLGSRFLQKMTPLQREYEFTMSGTFEVASAVLEKFYGGATAPAAAPAEIATLILTMTNGLAAGDERTFVITLTGVQIDVDSLPQDTTAVTFENITGFARTCGIVETDGTATTIFD